MDFLHGMKKECKSSIRSRREAESVAERESMAARTRGAMFGGESALPPWSESPLAAEYGAGMHTLMNEMSPGIVEGFWEERHHTLCERHSQLKRLMERLEEIASRISHLEIMAQFLSPHIPPLPASVEVYVFTSSRQLAGWARRSIASSRELAMQSTRVAQQSRRFVTRSRWASTQFRRWTLQGQQLLLARSRRFTTQKQRFLTRCHKSLAKSRRLCAHSRRFLEESRLFESQSGVLSTQCQLIVDCAELCKAICEEKRRATQLSLDYLPGL